MIRFLGQLTFFTLFMNILASSPDEKSDADKIKSKEVSHVVDLGDSSTHEQTASTSTNEDVQTPNGDLKNKNSPDDQDSDERPKKWYNCCC